MMDNGYSWKELELKFSELSKSLENLRLDYQWGSVPANYNFAVYNNQLSLTQFCTVASIAGNKLLEYKDERKFPDEIFLRNNPLYIWLDAIRILSGNFETDIIADQKDFKTGESLGLLYHGSLKNVVQESSNLCMRLTSVSITHPKQDYATTKEENRNKKRISKKLEKIIYQEANSKCSFCPESEIASLDIHHIISREEGGSNEVDNLILVCKNCHSKIHDGIISFQDIIKKKNKLDLDNGKDYKTKDKSVIISLRNNKIHSSIIAQQVNIKTARYSPKMMHPVGSIGADIEKNNYIKYLIEIYYKLKEADKSYGVVQRKPFNYGIIHKTIENKFRAKTYFIKQEKFLELCDYLYDNINRTIQGKRNRSKSIKNYKSFDEFKNI